MRTARTLTDALALLQVYLSSAVIYEEHEIIFPVSSVGSLVLHALRE